LCDQTVPEAYMAANAAVPLLDQSGAPAKTELFRGDWVNGTCSGLVVRRSASEISYIYVQSKLNKDGAREQRVDHNRVAPLSTGGFTAEVPECSGMKLISEGINLRASCGRFGTVLHRQQ
ncbi:MAG TPA: hypothetical protein VD967_01080, partial [Candidatus Paceibacterota bacterium]|nr:hypothetical protein [Candidatus Paceibacterota bacterium]